MRVSEIYLSVQGEGPNVGAPTIFVRFGGCNLRCALWPCDTPYAIFPKYRSEWKVMTPNEVYDEIERIRDDRVTNVCFTGGEPFLQNHKDLAKLYDLLHDTPGVCFVEAFSNGSLRYPDWVRDRQTIDVVMDWKLNGSGEGQTGTDIRIENFQHMTEHCMGLSVKFTIASREDYEQAKHIFQTYVEGSRYIPEVFAGVVWGKLENQQLVEWMLEDGLFWKLNVQVHNHVWDRSQRGI